jgi:hypothetical protein
MLAANSPSDPEVEQVGCRLGCCDWRMERYPFVALDAIT